MKHHGLLRRAVVATATAALLLGGLATAETASAATTGLVSGTAVTATLTNTVSQVDYSFVAEAGQHVTFSTTASTLTGAGAAGMYLYTPSNIWATSWVVRNGQSALWDFTAQYTGTWRISVLAGDATVTGSTTFTYATDAFPTGTPGTPATPNQDYVATTAVAGQRAEIPFQVNDAKTHLSLDVSASSWGAPGTANGYIFDPQGGLFAFVQLGNTPTYYDFTPNKTGRWKFVVDPDGSSTGSLTARLVTDQNFDQLQTNVAVTPKIDRKGQRAVYGIYGEAGKPLPVQVSASNWGSGFAYLFIFNKDTDVLVDHCVLRNTATSCPFSVPTTGAYRLILDPDGGATGEATFKRTT
ncbi:hypothetical protein [Kineosporia succinea]|uniref:Secreted protein n=1 Tax=Kineosporia succinea TaxID=84632 RepID=A0ABT9P2B2_9ACTN|nr:hypothetical protein [Kineosporia succinea]MDP9826826.1 hypothetical protein [Kineosporia succinea]